MADRLPLSAYAMNLNDNRFEVLSRRTVRTIPGEDFRAASVLAPIQQRPDGDYIILTQRSANLSSHSGQVAFPGGRVDPHDPSPAAAALREAHEEVGIEPGHVQMLGQLDQVVAGYNFLVTPFVGAIPHPYEFRLNPGETAAVFAVPVQALVSQGALSIDSRLSRRWGPIYHFQYEDWDIWGATARMVKQLLELVYGFEYYG